MDSLPLRLQPSDQGDMQLDPPQNNGGDESAERTAGETMSDALALRQASIRRDTYTYTPTRVICTEYWSYAFAIEERGCQKGIK
jgi:hypothetical protein